VFLNKGLLIGLVAVLTVAVVYFTATNKPSQNSQTTSPSPEAVSQQASPAASVAPSTEKVITVSGSEYSFSPKMIEVTRGEEVKLVYKNTGKLPHDLVLTELGVKTNVIAGGKEDTVTFTPEKSGTFTFYCSVGNHRQLGMEGTATVK
jgi:plastocyanin